MAASGRPRLIGTDEAETRPREVVPFRRREGRLEDAPWLAPPVVIIACVIVLFMAVQFVLAHRTWLQPFIRDFLKWATAPRVGGGPHLPAGPFRGAAVIAVVAGLGWLGARLLVTGESHGARLLRAGLGLVLAISVLGYAGTVAIVLGELTAPVLTSFIGIVGVGVLLSYVRLRREKPQLTPDDSTEPSQRQRLPRPSEPRPLRVLGLVMSITIVGLVFAHALLGPVQEWDAIVYHAETARQWFLARPDPPVLFGPSVGIQISSNYPPLFPASGAAIYTLVGKFDDTYLRLVSPTALVALLLLTLGYARQRFGPSTARIAALLLLGSPLVLLYGTWPTSYMLLAALLFASVVVADVASRSGRLLPWAGAGALAGLAILTHFYGLLAIAVGIAAMLVRRRLAVRALGVFAGTALLVAAPWLIRNVIELGDPFYPLASPPFGGRGLVEPFWTATKDEIRQNALSYWGGATGLELRVRLIVTALFDRHLLPTGLLLGLLFGVMQLRRRRTPAYLVMVGALFLLVPMLPGWFWLRALVPAIPVGAVLTGDALSKLFRASGSWSPRTPPWLRSLARVAAVSAIVGSLAAAGITALPLAIAGPNQHTWTPALNSSDQLMRGVENLGAARDQLWTAFAGDVVMWEWLNQNVRPGERIATLEIRTYYLDRPETLFYLDGREAIPLLRLRDPEAVQRFLRERAVRYVALPTWSVDGAARHPIVRVLPLFRMLGTRWFPAIAAFGTRGTERPSLVYSVGPTDAPPTVGVFPGDGAQPPPTDLSLVTFQAQREDPRIFVPLPRRGAVVLTFEYRDDPIGAFELNLFEPRNDAWQTGFYRGERQGTSEWIKAIIPLSARGDFVDLGVFVETNPLLVRAIAARYVSQPILLYAEEARLPDGGGVHVFRAGFTGGRVFVPVQRGGPITLSIEYLDAGNGSFDVNVLDPTTGEWVTGVATRELTGTGSWKSVRVKLSPPRAGFLEVGLFARDTDLRVRDARVRS